MTPPIYENLTHSLSDEILDRISNPVIVKDKQHRWVMINTAFCEFVGQPKDELIGKTDTDFFAQEELEVWWKQDDLVMETGFESINEEFVTDKLGNTRFFSTRKNIILDSEGNKLIVAILHDITEKKNLIEELQESNSMLSNYAHMVAHDLKSPLHTMTNFSQLLNSSVKDKLNGVELDYLKFITQAAKGMTEFVNSLLNFSKINSKKLNILPINVNHLVQEVTNNLGFEIINSGCELKIDQFPESIYADPKLISQIFQNLISNAIKFKAESRQLKISIQHKIKDGSHQFSICDNGIGIEDQYKIKIFEMFQRLHSNNKYEGSGLGLSICSVIAESHEGKIWVESELGKGSQFHFTIGAIQKTLT